MNLVQNFIITLGLLIGSLIVAARSTQRPDHGSRDFVLFITYLTQVIVLPFSDYSDIDLLKLYGPLNQLGYIYRSVNQSLVDTERLLALLNEPTEVNDKPDAPDLLVSDGKIEFGVC